MIEKVENNLKQMSFTSMMMRNLMHDLLDLAQFESGTFKISNEYFDLLQLIQRAFSMLEHFSSQKKITFSTHIESDSSCFQQIFGDERRYLQILINFLSNSLKFSPKNAQIIVRLKVTEKVQKSHCQLMKVLQSSKSSNNNIQGSSISLSQLPPGKQNIYISYELSI